MNFSITTNTHRQKNVGFLQYQTTNISLQIFKLPTLTIEIACLNFDILFILALLAHEQQLKIHFNSLEGSYALCLTANMIGKLKFCLKFNNQIVTPDVTSYFSQLNITYDEREQSQKINKIKLLTQCDTQMLRRGYQGQTPLET